MALGPWIPRKFLCVEGLQVSHAKHLQQIAATAAAWISSSSRALAAAALLALPLLAIVQPFRGLQHIAPTSAAAAAAVVTDVSAAAVSSTEDRQQQQRLLPLNDNIIKAEMQQLCEIVCQQVQGKIWLPDPSSSSSSTRWRIPRLQPSPHTAATAAADTSATAAMDDLIYQVTVDREGCVLGCKPCSSAAAAAYLELPLTAGLQGASLARVQAKYVKDSKLIYYCDLGCESRSSRCCVMKNVLYCLLVWVVCNVIAATDCHCFGRNQQAK